MDREGEAREYAPPNVDYGAPDTSFAAGGFSGGDPFLDPVDGSDAMDVPIYTEQGATAQDTSFASDDLAMSSSNVALEFTDSHVAPYAPIDGKIGSTSVPSVGIGNSQQEINLLPRGAELSSGPVAPNHGDSGGASGGRAPADPSRAWFWNPVRYQSYFDVDTDDVVKRMVDSLKGPLMPHFLNETRSNPDLYGPFWIATTVIFITAMTGNVDNYISHSKNAAPVPIKTGNSTSAADAVVEEIEAWFYDIDKVIYSSMLFYGYVGVIGLALWGLLMYFKSNLSLANIWCLYGYSLTIFLPVAPLCTIPVGWLQWIMVLLASTMSGLFLMFNLNEEVTHATGNKSFPILMTVFGLHLALGFSLKLFFFKF